MPMQCRNAILANSDSHWTQRNASHLRYLALQTVQRILGVAANGECSRPLIGADGADIDGDTHASVLRENTRAPPAERVVVVALEAKVALELLAVVDSGAKSAKGVGAIFARARAILAHHFLAMMAR